MKRLFLLTLCLALLLPTFAAAENADLTTLDSEIHHAFKVRKASGGVVVVAKEGKIVYEYAYGKARYREKTPVTMDSCFRTASVTKMITAIHVMQLVEQGKIDLDAPIGDYLGYPVKNPYYSKHDITMRMLMSHTASIHHRAIYSEWNLKELLYTARRGATIHAAYRKWAPGSKYLYSNFGAGIMGCVIESVTGKNINDSVTESLFDPLGINAAYHATLVDDTDQIVDEFNDKGSLRVGHTLSLEDDWDPAVNPLEHFGVTIGSVWTTGRGLCRIGMMLAGGGTVDGVTILQPESVQEMISDQKGRGGITAKSPYGLNVERVDTLVKGKMFYGHQGLSGNLLCSLYFDPETEFVFALFSNGTTVNMDRHICKLSRACFELTWEAFGGE